MASPPVAPTWGGSPASRPSDPIPHPTSATTSATTSTTTTITTVTTAAITPPPDTPTSRYSVASRASSSSSSGLDYYSHNSPPPPLSSQLHDHHRSISISSHHYDQSPVLAQAQVRASLHRKPVPLPEQDQHASPVIDPVHLSSPLSIKNNPLPFLILLLVLYPLRRSREATPLY
ncbi:uncharacterized protein N7473_011973 [Penicillium subrubescens]|uniref:uncharacterized protein n=1 Tax=Penicillium subrubescens TaxID=1316194 RepID=UPI002545809F|nr:uncharacterized protein N7473_011973 [Penicillium subrubescens]KAJ5880920.1 hypothetical protein N7473_011973 [Penicillium subrubescens]